MRAGYHLHGAVAHIHFVQGEPARNEIRWTAFPIAIVLMPENSPALPGGFEQRLIVEELDIRPDEILYHVQNFVMVDEPAKMDVAFAHLHDLQHLFRGFLLLLQVLRVVNGQVPETPVLTGPLEFVIVFAAINLDLFVRENFSNLEVATLAEVIDLILRERCLGFFALCFGHDCSPELCINWLLATPV